VTTGVRSGIGLDRTDSVKFRPDGANTGTPVGRPRANEGRNENQAEMLAGMEAKADVNLKEMKEEIKTNREEMKT
jgi:hypothetical protein